GRAGIGKTTILKELLKGKRGVKFAAYLTTGRQELVFFAEALGIREGEYTLEQLLDALGRMTEDGKVVLVIDHYPNFAKADTSFEPELFRYVTEVWPTGKVKLLLCSDAYLHMDKLVFSKKSIWKDVGVVRMDLGPLPYYECMGFFPTASPAQVAEYYGVTGGIPHYLKWAADSTARTIERIFLTDENESMLMPEKTIQMELREMSYYNRLLVALAGGMSRVNELSAEVEKPKDVVVPYLNTLMTIGIVTKENPVTEPTNRRKTRYSIVHFADKFWYQLVVPHIGLYYKRRVDELLDEHIMPRMEEFMQPVFIRMCRDYLLHKNEEGWLPFTIHTIGNWWENDEEQGTSEGFDLVAKGESEGADAMIFARCFYRDEPVGMVDLKSLIDLTRRINDKGATFYIIFSKNGFEENAKTVAATIKNIMLISLEEIVME
ncbi:MAG: hypothetical protein K6F00_10850, partial [Lachnospiraceae bacterium]|nr:hypothetical protein [Lachnospiraceae bacterium]